MHLWFLLLCIPAVFASLYRLPRTSEPNHYDLLLYIDVDGGKFNGSVTLNLTVTGETDKISLNYRDITILEDSVRLRNVVQGFELKRIAFYDATEIVDFFFDSPLPIGDYEFHVSFEGSVREDLKGIYMSYYWTDDGQKHQAATTFLAPIYARTIFPCYDEPHYKATFTVSILHSEKYHALSNMPQLTSPEIVSPGILQTDFESTPRMSTYLLAFIVSSFDSNSNEAKSFTIHSPTHLLNTTNYALTYGQTSLRKLEEYFEAPFQLPKLDLVAFDDFLMGAMENWGLLTFLSTRLLYDDTTMSVQQFQKMSQTISHELAHMWFGNEVTASWWSEIWLNEGFATLFEDIITDQVYPDWKLMDQFVYNKLHYAMERDATATVRAMGGSIETLDQIWDVYDYIPYQKAASVIRMIRNTITDDVFKKSVKTYIKEMSYKSAVPQDLYKNLAINFGDFDIEKMFKSWVETPGFPLVTVIRNYESSVIRVTQRRFIASESSEIPHSSYYIPINYATAKNPNFENTTPRYVLIPELAGANFDLVDSESVEKDDWVIVNINAGYYYRVNYDIKNWRLISEGLKENPAVISTASRAQLIDDAFTLARYDHLSYKVALDLISYFPKEREYVPTLVAIKHLSYLERIIRTTDIPFRRFIRKIFTDIYANVTLYHNPSDSSHLTLLLRSELSKFACEMEIIECLTEVSNEDISLANDPNTREAIFCGFFRNTDATSWPLEPFYTQLTQYTESEASKRKFADTIRQIINSFKCINNQRLRLSILNMTIQKDEKINFTPSEYNVIYQAVAMSGRTAVIDVLNFLAQNYERIEETYQSIPILLQSIGDLITSKEELNILKKIIDERVDLSAIASNTLYYTAHDAIITGEDNIAWVAKYSPTIDEWMKLNSSADHTKPCIFIIGSMLLMISNKILSAF
ncbi:Aminopeptidase [Sergentomyia squamirostris]